MKPISLKTAAFAAPLLAVIVGAACAPDDPTITNAGGMSSVAGTTSSTAGTTSSTAGTAGAGGSTSTAGTPAGGGSTSTAGTPPAGGTPSGGGTGGAPAGGAAMGGTGGGGTISVDTILSGESSFKNPGWKDSWWVTGCSSKHDHDCYTIEQCPAEGDRTKETFPVGGKPGQHYKVSFAYNAVNEGRGYAGGTKDKPLAGDINGIDNNDSFYRDGTAPDSKYNELRLTVFDDKGAEARHFFMNAFSTAQENHLAFLSSYKKSIVIIGGGKIEHMVFDSNCHAIDNCNAGEVIGTTCNAPRRLPGGDGQLMLPPFYANPNDGYKVVATNLISITAARTQPWKSQASHLKVTAIEETNDPVTMNYPDPQ
jgi:hypothetical protein